ncbi:MAG TPA: PHP domain-containing protein [Nitrospiraceae bacterium]|nr:PHP domain-containing protein [Nitrospiraceae bacterium]
MTSHVGRLDLHLHTTYSDGSLPPAEVLILAHKAHVTALAITDHDTVDGIPEALEAGERLGIEIIPGIEISSRLEANEVHILGYFVDWKDRELLAQLSRLREARHVRNPRIIERLNALHIEITYDEVKQLAKTDSIGRPHIARVLMNKGYVKSAKEAFDRYLADRAAAYVPRDLPSPAEAIAMVKAAHGVAVLAHPSWLDRSEGIGPVCEQLKSEGLDGVEVHYSTHRPEQTVQYLETARRLGLLVTGGSDFHGVTKPDIEVGIGRGTLQVPTTLLEPLRNAAG